MKYKVKKKYIIGNDFLDYFLWRFNQKRRSDPLFGLQDWERQDFIEKEMALAFKRKTYGRIEPVEKDEE